MTFAAMYRSVILHLLSIQKCHGPVGLPALGADAIASGEHAISCLVFMKTRRLERMLTIESLPQLDEDASDAFWGGALGLCRNQRVSRMIIKSAYGIFYENELANVSWLVMRDHDQTLPVRNVKWRHDEAEITRCYTLPRFRRMGLYSFAIRSLERIAAANGIKRVFMLANVKNLASRKGIEQAGLRRCWGVARYVTNLLPGERSITMRLHRLYLLLRRKG